MGDRLVVDRWAYGAVARSARSTIQGLLLFPLLRFLAPSVTRDADDVLPDLEGPVIVAANHVSHLDTPVILRALPRRIRRRLVVAAARDYFYRGRLRGALVSLSLATFPFDRGEGSGESVRQCLALLERGWSLLIFPEGTRSPTGELGRIRTGVGVLAIETSTAVLPLYVHGLADVMPKGTAAPLPGGVVVDVGPVIRPAPGESPDSLRDRVAGSLSVLAGRRPDWGRSATHTAGEEG